jgi:1-aminocyclopropane-1-carboxylate deaminase/D-cysteine desulfhydrase-like pyridoxal-dependent ACC family enzyme
MGKLVVYIVTTVLVLRGIQLDPIYTSAAFYIIVIVMERKLDDEKKQCVWCMWQFPRTVGHQHCWCGL